MKQYSKFIDINAVLNKAELSLELIEKEYNKSLSQQEILPELLVEIKDYLGNLKSSLDYLMNKVWKNNFPVRNTEKDFDKVTANLNHDLKLIIKKWQPFKDNQWIKWFNILNNKSKHITLIPQKRKETKETKISNSDGSSITFRENENCKIIFGNNVKIKTFGVPFDSIRKEPIPNNILKTEKTIWVNFEFEHGSLPNGVSVLPFLKICFENITNIVSDIEVLTW